MASSWVAHSAKIALAGVGLSLAGSVLLYWSYGDCLRAFFHFDDFWILGRVAEIRLRSIADVKGVFVPVHGFLLYRPLSTVGYFLALRALFGNDPFGYHLVQMGLQVVNAMLCAVLVGRIVRSTLAGWAVGLAYLTAPGLAIASCWPALCTVTAPTLFGLLALLCWLQQRLVVRVIFVPACFLLALAGSEHGVVIPLVLLVASAFLGDAPRRAGDMVLVAVLGAVSAAYVLLKLWYVREGVFADFPDPFVRAVFLSGYHVDWHPWVFFRSLGTYLFCALGPLWRFTTTAEEVKVGSGVLVVAALLATVAASLRTRDRLRQELLRAASFGLSWFIVSLLPVAFVPGRTGSYYISMGAPGLLLWLVGSVTAATHVAATRVAMAFTLVLILFHALHLREIRSSEEQRFFRNFTEAAERWTRTVADVQRLPSVTEIVVPDSWLAQLVFSQGQVARTLLCSDVRVTVTPNIEQTTASPGRVILREPFRYPGDPQARALWLPKRCP